MAWRREFEIFVSNIPVGRIIYERENEVFKGTVFLSNEVFGVIKDQHKISLAIPCKEFKSNSTIELDRVIKDYLSLLYDTKFVRIISK